MSNQSVLTLNLVCIIFFSPLLKNHTISGAIGDLHPVSEESFHFVIHQSIHTLTLDHHLLCPMQCRAAGVTINNCPKILTPLPHEYSHFIIAADDFILRTVLPLALQGLTSILNVFQITEGE